jgi:hypothetical protein
MPDFLIQHLLEMPGSRESASEPFLLIWNGTWQPGYNKDFLPPGDYVVHMGKDPDAQGVYQAFELVEVFRVPASEPVEGDPRATRRPPARKIKNISRKWDADLERWVKV